jgi:hypothetical protein
VALNPIILRAIEDAAIEDLIEGLVAGFPLCCVIAYAGRTCSFGPRGHLYREHKLARGYAGPLCFNRNVPRLPGFLPDWGFVDNAIDLPMIDTNTYVMCPACTEKYKGPSHENCPEWLPEGRLIDCFEHGCKETCTDTIYQKMLRWALTP